MTEAFRPRKQENQEVQNENEENESRGRDVMDMAEKIRQQVSDNSESPPSIKNNGPIKIQGNIPAAFMNALHGKENESLPVERVRIEKETKRGLEGISEKEKQDGQVEGNSNSLKELLESLKPSTQTFESILLPSKGKFYDGVNGPVDGILTVRPMTGAEEQILATPRLLKKQQAIDMIFKNCLAERFPTEKLLSIDRNFLLIYLRGISYGPSYDVEIKCPDCEKKFAHQINLDKDLVVDDCPEDFGPDLEDVLPVTKLKFSYRLQNGHDEKEINDYHERRNKEFGDSSTSSDDTLVYRTALLLDHIDGFTSKQEIKLILNNLPLNDLSYIRTCVNEPPFGVNNEIEMVCPNCLQEFETNLPLGSNFFSPRRKKVKNRA